MPTYLGRLSRMPREELAWRGRALARTQTHRVLDRLRPPRWDRSLIGRVLSDETSDTALRRAMANDDWPSVHDSLIARLESRPSRFVLDHRSADALVEEVRGRWPDATTDAAARADRIVDGQYDVLGYRGLRFSRGGDVDWHLDPVHGRRAPAVFWDDVPYLDPSVGDHKIIWELNRHQHWLQLGRATWLTGSSRYRSAIVERLASWLAANPPRTGINWASMLEIGLRAISWTWALHFLLAGTPREAGSREAPWLVDLLVALDSQLTHVEQNLSYYFSPNTHLIGEALALYVVGLALPELRASGRWTELGRKILLSEIARQIHADGGHREGSTHYHRYTLDMYLLALAAATRAHDETAIRPFTDAVARLAEFALSLADDRGRLPRIGDDDGGTVWPMTGRACDDVRDSLAVAAVLLRRPDLAPWGVTEEAFWIAGLAAIDAAPGIDDLRGQRTPHSHSFRDTGYVVLRDASGGHAVFDVGAHGYMNGGHAHADALGITLTVEHHPLLIDPGTSTYVMDRGLRDRLRASASHNTVTVDGRPQSIPSGPFHWRTRTDAQLVACRHNPAFDWAEAWHDGYAPLRHRRTLLRCSSGWLVADEILGHGPHTADVHWQFDPAWRVSIDAPGRLVATHGDGQVAWLLHDADSERLACGDEQSGEGWSAPVYGTLIPAPSAHVARRASAPFAVVTWIGIDQRGDAPSLARLTTIGADASGAIASRITAGDRESVFLLRSADSTVVGDSITVAGFETDARLLHCSRREGRLASLELVDARRAHAVHDGGLNVTSTDPIPDLHIGFEDGVMDLYASRLDAPLRLEGHPIRELRAIRLNGREALLSARDGTNALTIDPSQLNHDVGAPLATLPGADGILVLMK